jgi:hypothetical protein
MVHAKVKLVLRLGRYAEIRSNPTDGMREIVERAV